MTKRKRRRRGTTVRSGSAGRQAAPETSGTTAKTRAGRRRSAGPLRSTSSSERAPAPREAREQAREATRPAIHPPGPQSLARGLAVVGGSPAILLSSFLAVLGLWAALFSYATLIAAAPPSLMVLFQSLPPLHSRLVDLQLIFAGRTVPAFGAFAFVVGLLLFRAAITGLGISLMLDRFEGADVGMEAVGTSVRKAVARVGRSLYGMFAIELGFLALVLLSVFVAGPFLGAELGQLAVMAVLIGGMYFFVYAPVIVVAEGVSPRSAVRLAIRTARIPGPRHLVFTVGYIAISLLVSQLAPSGRLATATPPVTVWAYVLFANVLHLSAQAALVYRWLSVRGHIVA
jgi:hypothetical protein